MQSDILNKIYEKNEEGERAALVLLTKNRGSTPGADGSTMAVFEDGSSVGTVGGGAIEFDVTKRSKEAIEKGEDFEFDYNLSQNGELKMACGGDSKGVVKIFYPNNKLVIFGAGHVSQKLARIATKTGFDVYVTDDREEFEKSEDFEGIKEYLACEPEEACEKIKFNKDNTFVVVCTRGHKKDEDAVEELLKKDYKYLGLIGSRKKVGNLIKNLKEKGISEEAIKTINMPVGLNIDNGSVEEIAISILAEILMIKNDKDGKQMKIDY